MGVPMRTIDDIGDAAVVIMGAPLDWGTSYRPGARFGPAAVRAVGNALNVNPFRSVLCHRVVQSSDKVGGYVHGPCVKEAKLRKEGVKIVGGKVVDFKKVLQRL